MSRIGIYSGSFNPVHFGHLMVGYYTLVNSSLDEVWFSVSPQNPLKDPSILSDVRQRVDALQQLLTLTHIDLAVSPKRLCVTDYELKLPVPSYTYDLLQHLRSDYPNDTFALIIGQDSLNSLRRWKSWQELVERYELYVYPRDTTTEIPVFEHPKGIHFFRNAPLINLSSTTIRNGSEVLD